MQNCDTQTHLIPMPRQWICEAFKNIPWFTLHQTLHLRVPIAENATLRL
jgi:hypothetical protein